VKTNCHCERSEAIQLMISWHDCFVALLLAMTRSTEDARDDKTQTVAIGSPPPANACAARSASRSTFPRAGLARSFAWQPACAWCCLRDLCRKLAQALPHHRGKTEITRFEDNAPRPREAFADAAARRCFMNAPLAAHGQHPARAVQWPHRPATALSYRDRRIAGVGLYREPLVPLKGFPAWSGSVRKEEAHRS